VTFVPPGNVFSRVTLDAAAAGGIRYVSCLEPGRFGPVDGLTWVADGDVVALHDRDLVLGGLAALERVLRAPADTLVTVREVGARLARGAR